MAPRIVAPYTRTMCVPVHVCDLDGRYHANSSLLLGFTPQASDERLSCV